MGWSKSEKNQIMKPILISLAPNNFSDDVQLSLKTICQPGIWSKGKNIDNLEVKFRKYLKLPYIFSFNSGRSALMIGLKALNFPKGSEVITQAFSCVAIPNSIRFAGLIPVFADINKSGFNLDVEKFRQKITKKTKAVIIQNLFGIPDDIKKILNIAKKYNLVVIEDCAQCLGAKIDNQLVGTFGKFSFFSFGRDKVISSTFGGLLATKDLRFAKALKLEYDNLGFPSPSWTFRQLLHPILFSLIVPTYFSGQIGKYSIGKGLVYIMQQLNLLDLPVKKSEKKGFNIADYPKKLPNALAILSSNQFDKLSEFNKKRKEVAQYYYSEIKSIKNVQTISFNKRHSPIFLRFPVLVSNPSQLRKFAIQWKIILGNWYDSVIAPQGSSLGKSGYFAGSCPEAELKSKSVLNLPTYPKMNMADAGRVIKVLKKYYELYGKRN